MLHVSHSLGLAALILAKDASCHAIGICSKHMLVMHGMIAHHDLSDILILRVALHTLHIKIAAIEAISQVVHIIKQVALCAARLVVDFDLIYDSSTFNVELRVETSRDSTTVLDSICFLFELLILLKCGGKNSLSRATLLLAVKLASTE